MQLGHNPRRNLRWLKTAEVVKQHTERDDHFGDLGGALKERAHRTADDDVVVDGQGEQVQQRHYVSRVDQGLPEHVGARLRVAVDNFGTTRKSAPTCSGRPSSTWLTSCRC